MAFERTEADGGLPRIEGFRGKGIVVAGEVWNGGFLICGEQLWEVGEEGVNAVETTLFEPLLQMETRPDVLLIGTGSAMKWPDFSLLEDVRSMGLEPEVMDSRAAARTYNLLLAEGRAVAALILPLNA
ncbi:MAG: Mth938-like domain-containing protein [Pacificimonas sp.]|jgi:uncharacterized protein|nr:Mth938-like domain-containing protein [Pacificimonas sp.]